MTRSKITKIIIGVLLLVLGGLWLVESFGIFDFDFDLFFDGWWAVLCMVIFLISIISDGPNFGNILCFCIFFVLFLNARDLIPERFDIWLLLFALIVLFIGVRLIFGAFKKSSTQVTPSSVSAGASGTTQANDNINHTHTKYLFTGETVRFAGVTVGKLSFEVNFASLTLDFTGAVFTEESSVTVNTNFGETKIQLPADVRADVMQDVAFGSVKNLSAGSQVVRMKLDCAFGAISVKNV